MHHEMEFLQHEFRHTKDEKVEQEKLSGRNLEEEEKLVTTKLVRENSCY